jgi:hypothetical protein
MRDDPSVSADASTGRWDGSRMDSYAIDVILTHIGAFEPPMDVSAETPLLVAA